MRLRIIRRDLPLKHVMTVFRGTISVIRTVVVEVEQDGLRGYGEASEDQHRGVMIEDMTDVVESAREKISRYSLADPVAFVRCIKPSLEDYIKKTRPEHSCPRALCSSALSALEMAVCDLWGKMRNAPLWRIWGFQPTRLPKSSYTLGLDSLYRILEKFNEQPDWPLYRVKLGSYEDMNILRELRKRTSAPFRIDVNGCWTFQQALDYLEELTILNVELIEQPLHPDDWDGMARLKEICPIPLFADESCCCEEDLEKCRECFDGVNLKPVKFGGLNAAKRMLDRAVAMGFKTMIGNTIESLISASAVAQFAPKLDYVYLDGPLLVERTPGVGVGLARGRITLPRENGVGFALQSRARQYVG